MIRAGVLLDSGPLVALLSRTDENHERATELTSRCQMPLRTCEAVLAEACFLLTKVHPAAPADVLALGRRGAIETTFFLGENWSPVEGYLRKYRNIPASLADACLIRCAELYEEARILTFDSDFRVYRWRRNRKFEVLE